MSDPQPPTSPEAHPQTPAPSAAPRGGHKYASWLVLFGMWGIFVASRTITAAPPALVGLVAGLPALWVLGVGLCAAAGWRWGVGMGRRWPAGLAALSWVLVWGRAWIAWPTSDGPPNLRAMTWNVQRLGFEDQDDSPSLNCVVETVQAADPNAIALMEVSARDVERLSARLDLDCTHIDYRGTGHPSRGGVAACARGPGWRLGEAGPRRFVSDINWYYAFAEIISHSGDRIFNLAAVHLQPYRLGLETSTEAVAAAQRAETEALLERVARFRDPTIVAGDFNSTRDAPVHADLRRHLTDVWEQASWGPGATARAFLPAPLRIDYIYVSDTFQVARSHILDVDCSDHSPVVADLVIQPNEAPRPR